MPRKKLDRSYEANRADSPVKACRETASAGFRQIAKIETPIGGFKSSRSKCRMQKHDSESSSSVRNSDRFRFESAL